MSVEGECVLASRWRFSHVRLHMPNASQGLVAINVFDLSSILGRPVFAFAETLDKGLAIGSGAGKL